MLGDEGRPHLVYGGTLYPWSPGGYLPPVARPAKMTVTILTPPSIVRTLSQGYQPCIHLSATEIAAEGGTPCDKWRA